MSQNGFLLDSELEVVQGTGRDEIRLGLGYAAILREMQHDADLDGVAINLVSSYMGAAGYRSWATQLDMRNPAHAPLYDITPGIVPGLPSEHGTGQAADYNSGLAWVKENGHLYGVTFPLAFDHNHGEWDGVTLAGEDYQKITDDKPNEATMDGTTYHAVDGGIAGIYYQLTATSIHVFTSPAAAQYVASLSNRAIAYAVAADYPAWNGALKNGLAIDLSSANMHVAVEAIGAPSDLLELLATGNVLDATGARLNTWSLNINYTRNAHGQLVQTPEAPAASTPGAPVDLGPLTLAIAALEATVKLGVSGTVHLSPPAS